MVERNWGRCHDDWAATFCLLLGGSNAWRSSARIILRYALIISWHWGTTFTCLQMPKLDGLSLTRKWYRKFVSEILPGPRWWLSITSIVYGPMCTMSTESSRSGTGNVVPKKNSPSAVKSGIELDMSSWYALIRPKWTDVSASSPSLATR